MCHEYGMRWWKSESPKKKQTEDAKPDLLGMFTPRQDDQPKAAPAGKVEEKELVTAK